jgi:predicted flap endonuclease-1-like 5' DNA nuclease
MNHVLEEVVTLLDRRPRRWRRWAAEPERVAETEEIEDEEGGGGALFFWGLLTALTLWWLYLRPMTTERRAGLPGGVRARVAQRRTLATSRERRADSGPEASGAAVQTAENAEDDLTVIYGIGPARAARLREAGIGTFAALSELDATQLRALMQETGLAGADPSDWPRQASLAAGGDWEALEAYKDQLRAERG